MDAIHTPRGSKSPASKSPASKSRGSKSPASKSPASKSPCSALDKTHLDEKLIADIKNSLKKAESRQTCKYDCSGTGCYQTNPAHSSKFSHPKNYSMCDISLFKIDTDTFLNNSYTIYECNKGTFSLAWYTEMSAQRGLPNKQLATMEYDKYDSLIFLILANIIVNIKEYIAHYGAEFLNYMTNSLEASDNTGLFYIKPETPLGKIMTKYSPKDRDTHKIDYRLGNSTIRLMIIHIIEKKLIKPSSYRKQKSGGKYIKGKHSVKGKHTQSKKRRGKTRHK